MRLHHLEVQAFGPFAATATIDFDELSEAGLFLLSGATGAGKTSVLDAVCFALYGDVPGDRAQAKRLRSDQADPTVPPRVTLEATLGGRRFRIVRSPAWERAKKRGAGTTTEQARVTLSERVGGAWQPLSSRIDETADLVRSVVGLDLTQFTQVAMLPQGRFQAFLRADSKERHQLLQRLFRTGRFEAVERHLRDRRVALGRESALAHQRVADVVSRVSEAAGAPLPDDADVHDLAPVVDDGRLRAWVGARLEAAGAARAEAAVRATVLAGAEATARRTLETARADHERRERLVAARREHAALVAAADAHEHDVARLDRARRAADVVPWHRLEWAARVARDEARAEAGRGAVRVAQHLGSAPDRADLAGLADRALADAAAASAARPLATRLAAFRSALVADTDRTAGLAAELERVQRERTVRPDRLESLRAEALNAGEDARRVEVLTVTAQELRARLDAHGLVADLEPELQVARHDWLAAREQTLTLRTELLHVQTARIDGMAAELADALAVGGCCPVCGSGQHPDLARPAPGAPDAGVEKRARSAVDDAAVEEHARDQQVRDLERSLAGARARTDGEAADVDAARLGEVQEALAAAHRSAGRLPDLVARLADDERALADLDRRSETLLADLGRARSAHDERTEEAGRLAEDLADVLGDHADLDRACAAHRRTAELCRAAVRAADAVEAAESTHAETRRAVETAVATADFGTLDAALDAMLDPPALGELSDTVAHHERRRAAVTEVLRDAGPDDDRPLPDLAVLAERHDAGLAELQAAGADARVATARVERLTGLRDDVDRAVDAWSPVRAEHAVVSRLSSFVEGTSPDNLLRMRLSAYVLAYRLSQVVAAANERLAGMSDQRYSLEHTGHRGAGESRGGLSLLVRDDWSGESRDPATLSGGETFVVSLALALGLADVIADEAGGARLDTLFVDEGFGSLDADTLDDVMDTLDALRDGGRVVGVVSHVTEMRDRIPTQLQVSKSRVGSTLRLRR